MNWMLLSQYADIILALGLIIRLRSLRLHRVYFAFAVFLGYDLLQSTVELVESALQSSRVDYRVTWMLLRPPAWVLYLWVVQTLLAAILHNLPGIERGSKILFHCIFLGAITLALLTALPEYFNRNNPRLDPVDRALVLGVALERAISIAAILVLLGMLTFILWFPVQIPRNLAALSSGFVVYFGAKTTLLFMLTYLPRFYYEHRSLISICISFILAGCLAYWLRVVNALGEVNLIRLGHRWQASEQVKLLSKLEAMNAALLGSRS